MTGYSLELIPQEMKDRFRHLAMEELESQKRRRVLVRNDNHSSKLLS